MTYVGVYEMGYELGLRKGEQRILMMLYEERMGRSLHEGERAVLIRRMEKLGRDRLLKAPYELSGDALAAWLGDPNAT